FTPAVFNTAGGNFTVNGNTNLTSGAHSVATVGGDILFNGTIDARSAVNPAALTLDASGSTVTGDVTAGDIGQLALLDTLTILGSTLDLAKVATRGAQQYTGNSVNFSGQYRTGGADFTVNGDTLLASGAHGVTTLGGNILFNGLIDSRSAVNPAALTLDASGSGTTGAVTVGNIGQLDSLDVLTIMGSTLNLFSVTTTGAQQYTGNTVNFNSQYQTNGGDFTVNGDTLLASGAHSVATLGGNILFNGLIDSQSALSPGALTLDATGSSATGNVTAGDIGQLALLDTLTILGSTLDLSSVATSGVQQYTGSSVNFKGQYRTGGAGFTVNGDTLLASGAHGVATQGGSILFNGMIDAIANGGLNLSAGTGNIVFSQNVGTLGKLGQVNISSANDVKVNGQFIAGNMQVIHGGNFMTGPLGFLQLDSLFINPGAQSAMVSGSVGGQLNQDAALVVMGPNNDPDFTINACVIGLPCGLTGPTVIPPGPMFIKQVPPTGPMIIQPVPPTGQMNFQQVPPPGQMIASLFFQQVPSTVRPQQITGSAVVNAIEEAVDLAQGSTGKTLVEPPQVYFDIPQHPPSDDPTQYQYSNLGNDELWDNNTGGVSVASFAAFSNLQSVNAGEKNKKRKKAEAKSTE
ncbi:MAG: hypothetical protein ACRERU_14465, partial [Methylococcales bacterium]